MHLKYRNVHEAFHGLIEGVGNKSIPTSERSSRNGQTITVDEPTTITLTHPWERVLLNPVRDCNPFFHVYEAMWMLAGRNQLADITRFIKGFGLFSNDGVTIPGAYGYRWRHARFWDSRQNTPGDPWIVDVDQLNLLIEHLKAKPDSRRAILLNWMVDPDLTTINESKDCCCNTHVMFSLRVTDGEYKTLGGLLPDGWEHHPINMKLDMTVVNRSNDLILGLCGANMVHFSFLQQYMAEALGVQMGLYHTFTNNLHIYTDGKFGKPFNAAEWLVDHEYPIEPYKDELLFDLVSREEFDAEVRAFAADPYEQRGYMSPFLDGVARPLMRMHQLYSEGNPREALEIARGQWYAPWFRAAAEWINRRIERKAAKNKQLEEGYK